jgi:hypothetical protein
MENLAKEAVIIELKDLLEKFTDAVYMRNATPRDYRRLEARIYELCDMLDQFDQGGK